MGSVPVVEHLAGRRHLQRGAGGTRVQSRYEAANSRYEAGFSATAAPPSLRIRRSLVVENEAADAVGDAGAASVQAKGSPPAIGCQRANDLRSNG